METRLLGKTGLKLPVLSFGASSLGQEFRSVTLDEALASVRTALDCGLNFIDTSPFYGRGMSEVLLGVTLQDVLVQGKKFEPLQVLEILRQALEALTRGKHFTAQEALSVGIIDFITEADAFQP